MEDALNATKAAVEEGIVIGGGCTLIKLAAMVSLLALPGYYDRLLERERERERERSRDERGGGGGGAWNIPPDNTMSDRQLLWLVSGVYRTPQWTPATLSASLKIVSGPLCIQYLLTSNLNRSLPSAG